MSRITPPVAQIAKRLSSSANTSRTAGLIELKNISNSYETLDRHDHIRTHSTMGKHRPTTSTASAIRTIPLMQGFQTSSAPAIAAARSVATMDRFFLPDLAAEEASAAMIRVPLLPDNYAPDRSANSAHAPDRESYKSTPPEINIVAAHPEIVLPAVMTERVGNESIDFDLGALTTGFAHKASEVVHHQEGVLKELWTGLVDDVFGGPKDGTPKPTL